MAIKAYIATDYKVAYTEIDDNEFVTAVRALTHLASNYEERYDIKVLKTSDRATGVVEFYKSGLEVIKEKSKGRWVELCEQLLASAPEYNDYVRVELR